MSVFLLEYNVVEKIGNRMHKSEPTLCMKIQTLRDGFQIEARVH